MLETLKPSSLKGNGMLGKKVEYVQGDTQTKPDAARAAARRMIERDGVIMFSGGSSSAVAVAQQYLAQEKGVIFMDALTHSNDTTGKDRRRYGFRHFFNAYMSGKALGPILAKEYGKDRRAFHLTADYTWGHTQYESMKDATEKQGWTTVNNIMTPLGATDFSQFLTAALNTDADVLVLNHYGEDMINSLTQAVRFGMRDKRGNGKQMQVVVPLYSRLMATGAGRQHRRRLRHDQLAAEARRPGSQVFVKAFEEEYGPRRRRRRRPPTSRRSSTPTPWSGRHVLSAGGHQGARGLRVRGDRSEQVLLSRRRPPGVPRHLVVHGKAPSSRRTSSTSSRSSSRCRAEEVEYAAA